MSKQPTPLSLLAALVVTAGLAAAPALADAPVKGSIRVPATMKVNPKATDAQLNAESKKLARLAKLTPAQAIAVARRRAHGKVDKIVLENEDGYVAYAVFLGGHEVLVDAGNGKILGDERESPTARD